MSSNFGMPTSPGGRTHGVESARRVLRILFEFTHDNPRLDVEAISEALECSVPSVYRYMALLREFELVESYDPGVFQLTPRVYALTRSVDRLDGLKSAGRPVLERLSRATGETAVLVRELEQSIICIDSVETDQALRLTFTPGQMLPMHRGASAKIILASLDKRSREHYLHGLHASGVMTLKSVDHLNTELDVIAATGYAESISEVDKGTWASAAAIELNGLVVAAVSVAGPSHRLGKRERKSINNLVRVAAKDISRRLNESQLSKHITPSHGSVPVISE